MSVSVGRPSPAASAFVGKGELPVTPDCPVTDPMSVPCSVPHLDVVPSRLAPKPAVAAACTAVRAKGDDAAVDVPEGVKAEAEADLRWPPPAGGLESLGLTSPSNGAWLLSLSEMPATSPGAGSRAEAEGGGLLALGWSLRKGPGELGR